MLGWLDGGEKRSRVVGLILVGRIKVGEKKSTSESQKKKKHNKHRRLLHILLNAQLVSVHECQTSL